MLGEGALSAAFIPEYTKAVKHEPGVASPLASATVFFLLIVSGLLMAVIEIGLIWYAGRLVDVLTDNVSDTYVSKTTFAVSEFAGKHGLFLIEDCAHAHGTFWRGRGVGSWGHFGSFSMQRSKLMTAGEGGALICNDEQLRDRAWAYADCGRVKGEWFYHHASYGSNLRMSEWQGTVLRAQLARFPEQNLLRNQNAIALNAALEEIPGIHAPMRDPRMNSQGNYCFVFHYDATQFANLPLRRFEAALAAEGIPMGVSCPALSDLAVFRNHNFAPRLRASAPDIDYSAVHLPKAEAAAASTVWLQHRLLLADREDVLDVARAVARIQASAQQIMNA